MQRIVTYLLLLASFYSCQKDNQATPNRPQGNEGYYIDSIYEYWPDYADGPAVTYAYSYDALNRVSQIKDYSKAEGPVVNGVKIFSYQGNNMLPYAMQNNKYAIYNTEEFHGSATNFYTFNPDGKLLVDSMWETVKNSISVYGGLYQGEVIHVEKYSYPASDYFLHTSLDSSNRYTVPRGYYEFDSVILDGSANVIQSFHYDGAPWEPKRFRSSEKYTYDAKPNPFRKLNLYGLTNRVSHEGSVIEGGAYGFQSDYNVSQTLYEDNYNKIDYPILNSYNSLGLLERQVISYDYYPNDPSRIILQFVYKKL